MATGIEWTDETWNPVTGCTRVSPGCDNCYMFAQYPRLRGFRLPGYDASPDVVQTVPERLDSPVLRKKKPAKIFVNSMSDLFHPAVSFEFINRVFRRMKEASDTHGHVFQVLTKRPGRAVGWWNENVSEYPEGWPPKVWIGTSVENQKYAPRLDVLSRLPAPIRFVSVEPLLEEVDLSEWLVRGIVQWVIVGGESGPRARPMRIDWVRSLLYQTREADETLKQTIPDHHNIAFFLKQLGGRRGKRSGEEAILDGRTILEMPEQRHTPVHVV